MQSSKLKYILYVFVLSVLLSFSAFAQNDGDMVKIYVNRSEIVMPLAAVIEDSRTLAPIRPVAEACGIEVGWDAESGKVTLTHGYITVSFREGDSVMTVYNSVIDEIYTSDLVIAPVIRDSMMFVTLRPVLETFGATLAWDANHRMINITTQGASDGGSNVQEKPVHTEENAPKCEYTGFREMKDHKIIRSAPHGLYGRIKSESPITLVRCRIVDTDMDYTLRFDASDNITNYNVFTYFDRLICFSDAGLGDRVFEVYAANDGGEGKLLFSYGYTVIEKDAPKPEETQTPEDSDVSYSDVSNGVNVTDTAVSAATISYYGFRKMNGDSIVAGAPHGLYGNVVSDRPITVVRCRIAETDMDYSVTIPDTENVTEYNVFTYFDPIIRFSDAGDGVRNFEIYAGADNAPEQLIFSYTYTIKTVNQASGTADSSATNVNTSVPAAEDVCLPLEGTVKVTSPYGFRAYNKWEFHKGVDIISDSLAIISVADGVVVDCATGKNSGVGNYVAIQHNGGWVSLYYHLASYDVETGDTVRKGQRFATMGNTGGNYGVHLHFMTCDKWYGSIWATQNNHHTPPHQYVPQLLTDVMFYNPSFEKVNTDKMILCTFRFPGVIAKGSAFSISSSKPFVASENPLKRITLTITDESGNIVMSECMENPEYTKNGIYTYTAITTAFDMMCEFDKLPVGKMKVSITTVSELGRERVVYEKNFEVTGDPSEHTDNEAEAVLTPEEAAQTDAFEAGDGESIAVQ